MIRPPHWSAEHSHHLPRAMVSGREGISRLGTPIDRGGLVSAPEEDTIATPMEHATGQRSHIPAACIPMIATNVAHIRLYPT